MADNTSTGLGRMVESLTKAVVVNSAYLLRGTVKVPVDQMKGKMVGETYDFTVPQYGAKYSESLDANGKVILGAFKGKITTSLKIGYSGSSIKPNAVAMALEMPEKSEIVKETGAGIANEFAINVAMRDFAKAGALVSVSNANNAHTKKIKKEAARLVANYKAKVIGFASPEVIGEIEGDGRQFQPIDIDPAWGVGLEGKWGNISELRSMALPSTNISVGTNTFAYTKSTNTVAVAKGSGAFVAIKAGDLVKLTGVEVYIYFCEDVAAAGNTTNAVVIGASGDIAATAADTTNVYAPIIMRCEGAQAWGDATDCLDAIDTKVPIEGMTVAESVVKQGGFTQNYEFATAGAAGLAMGEKASVVFVKVN